MARHPPIKMVNGSKPQWLSYLKRQNQGIFGTKWKNTHYFSSQIEKALTKLNGPESKKAYSLGIEEQIRTPQTLWLKMPQTSGKMPKETKSQLCNCLRNRNL